MNKPTSAQRYKGTHRNVLLDPIMNNRSLLTSIALSLSLVALATIISYTAPFYQSFLSKMYPKDESSAATAIDFYTYQSSYSLTRSKPTSSSVWINNQQQVALNAQTTWTKSVSLTLGDNAVTISYKNSSGTQVSSEVLTIRRNGEGDINGDASVSVFDLGILIGNYNQSITTTSTTNQLMSDCNNDQSVNVFDLGILAAQYGQSYSYQIVSNTPTPTSNPKTPTPTSGSTTNSAEYTYSFQVSRNVTKNIYYNDLTYIVHVGEVGSPAVTVGTVAVSSNYNAQTGDLKFTTDKTGTVNITFSSSGTTNVTVKKAALKDDRGWAWSHGMDDNVNLSNQINAIAAKGWRASLMLISKDIDETRQEGWIIDKPGLRTLVNQGWSLGNHTWDHNCSGGSASEMNATIIDGYNKLMEIVNTSNRPSYKVITFAAPCFISNYNPYIDAMRKNGTTSVLFNETQGNPLMIVDGSDYSSGGMTADSVNSNTTTIGRDTTIESGPADAISTFAWMSANKNASRHFWFNSLTHGNQEDNLTQVLNKAYSLYGPGGTNEIWMAPSDEIYSYLMIKETTEISGGTLTKIN
ncbi:hypothetical protein HGA91_03490 [candidate division WWE3 bacterium]|nr:hypothetical protein [candidate division WWE3 bacterium]